MNHIDFLANSRQQTAHFFAHVATVLNDFSLFFVMRQDRRNFVRSPPAGVQFQFDYETFYPVAQATLAVDPNLETMRFELVPKM